MKTITVILAAAMLLVLTGCESEPKADPSVPPPVALESRPGLPAPVQLTPQPQPAPPSPYSEEEPVVMTFDESAKPIPQPVPQPTPTTERPTAGTVYVVQRGDTLYNIAMRFYGNRRMVEDIMAANPTIKDVNKIYVGQKLTLP